MCRKISLLFSLFFLHQFLIWGQNSLTLETCLKLAKENYPLIKQKRYLESISQNSQSSINSTWLPQINVVGKATYQSEVTSLSIPGMSMNIPKDNYSIGLQINQTLYDFGQSSQHISVEKASTQSEIQKTETELYKLNDKILQLYGNILLTQENLKILNSYLEDIQSRQKNMENTVKSGMALQSNLDILDAENLKTSQKLIETQANLKMLCQTLSVFVNQSVSETTNFSEMGLSSQTAGDSNNRPEYQYFESQKSVYSERIKLLNRKSLPRFYAFAEGDYGRPGYNFLDTKLRPYGTIGLGLTWNINGLYTKKYDVNTLNVSKLMVDEQREVFDLNQKTALIQQNGEIDKLKQLLETDKTIINKRIEISKTAANQVENGIITSSDYISLLNAEKQAQLNESVHKIQLGIALENYKIIVGIKN